MDSEEVHRTKQSLPFNVRTRTELSRRPAIVTQATVARAIRAAMQAGAGSVDVLPDGTIRISLSPLSTPETPSVPVAPTPEVVL